jgi:hypothetical protein
MKESSGSQKLEPETGRTIANRFSGRSQSGS